jgi:asparagine synthase (glutamine-hydrolysing)
MCGIYWYLRGIDRGDRFVPTKHTCLEARGPDQTAILDEPDYYAAFYRLAIVGVDDGMQPFISEKSIVMCNGEIYNSTRLEYEMELKNTTGSDCECISRMYADGTDIENIVRQLSGEFAFVLHSQESGITFFARDRFGRKPLYYSISEQGDLDVCSLYAGTEFAKKQQVLPGVLYSFNQKRKCLSQMPYHTFSYNPTAGITEEHIMDSFIEGIIERATQTEREIGILISGGFDSSFVASTVLKYCKLDIPLHAFTIGFDENAPDVIAAEIMVNYLRAKYGPDCIKWHRVILTVEEAIAAIPDVIKALETYDTTTIRASVPMYLISKYIRQNTNVRVILSGEGSDELFGGYLYFKYVPDVHAFTAEICKLLRELYLFDVLRADRATAAWGLEVRTPFLDDDFVQNVLSSVSLMPSDKNTKMLIRQIAAAYDMLPDEILWGKKEAFSDAVGLSWKDAITKHAETFVEQQEGVRFNISNVIVPKTDEMLYYQYIFGGLFPDSWHLLPKLWLPNQDWVDTGIEPSARVLSVYDATR